MIVIECNDEFYSIKHLSDIEGCIDDLAFADYQSDIQKHVQNIIEICAAENIECCVTEVK